MHIMYINNDGGGFADYINVDEGTTVAQLFHDRVSDGDPGSYLIRVNRQPSTRDQQLQEGDRVSFTPTKIEGATSAKNRSTPSTSGRIPGGWLRRRLSGLVTFANLLERQVRRWRNRRTTD